METANIVIVGGGIAGASLAYFLAQEGVKDVILLEREATPGHHSSGRSAAISREWNADPITLTLKRLSHKFLNAPPEGFAEVPIFEPCGVLDVVSPEDAAALEKPLTDCQRAGIEVERWNAREVCHRVPLFREQHVGAGMFLVRSGNIAIHELLSGYLTHARAGGVEVRTATAVTGIDVAGGRLTHVHTSKGSISTPCVINAAGAWADQLYAMAGGTPLGIVPMRRTIIVPTAPSWYQPGVWPHTSDLSHQFYVKPEGQSIIASPMDEDPIEPCDARPDDLRVAEIADRLERFSTFRVPSLDTKWAGLRSFAPDRQPVVGEDPVIQGFFWLAGQGGTGVSTSPAMGQIAADVLLRGDTQLIDKALLNPLRLAT